MNAAIYQQLLKNNNIKDVKSTSNGGKVLKKRTNGFFMPTTKLEFQKLIEICKQQVLKHKETIEDDDTKTNQFKNYYKQLYLNRNLRQPPKNFLVQSLPINYDEEYHQTLVEKNIELNEEIKIQNIKSIVEHIKSTNSKFFHAFDYNSDSLNYKYKCIAVDGTCCVGKSTLLTLLDHQGISHLKSNSNMFSTNINTHPTYSLGYSHKSLELMEQNKNTVWDRSPHNNILWFKIWYMLTITQNVEVLDKSHFYEFRAILESESSEVLEETFLTCIPNIIIINSDEDYCKQKLFERNTGSDVERSFWKHYITLQNFAYSWLANKYINKIILIDAAQYINKHQLGLSLLQEAIVEIIKEILPKLNHIETFSTEKLNKHKLSYFIDSFHVENKMNPIIRTFQMDLQKKCVDVIKQQCIEHGPLHCSTENILNYFNQNILEMQTTTTSTSDNVLTDDEDAELDDSNNNNKLLSVEEIDFD